MQWRKVKLSQSSRLGSLEISSKVMRTDAEWRNHVNQLGRKLGCKDWEDWYQITDEQFGQLGGKSLLRKFNDLPSLLNAIYPEKPWSRAQFPSVPRSFWHQRKNCRSFFIELGHKLGFRDMDDWYRIRAETIMIHGGATLLSRFRYSVVGALEFAFDDWQWLPWRFEKCPNGYWKNKTNQKKFIDWFRSELNIRTLDDWYTVKAEDFLRHGGSSLLDEYDGEIHQLLQSIYEGHSFLPWRFERVASGFWNSHENQRSFMAWLGVQLKNEGMEDWYIRSRQDFVRHGGRTLLDKYGGSFDKLLQSVFPEHKWIPWKFDQVSKGYWDKMNQQQVEQALSWIRDKLYLREMQDWYLVSPTQVSQIIPNTFLKKFHLPQLLLTAYPEHVWSSEKLLFKNWYPLVKGGKRLLLEAIKQLFPDLVIRRDFRCSMKDSNVDAALFPFQNSKQRNTSDNQLFLPLHSLDYKRLVFDQIGKSLGLQQLEDWYRLFSGDRKCDTKVLRGLGIRNSGLIKALQETYPEHHWIPWKFNQRVPRNYWDKLQNQKVFCDWLIAELHLKGAEGLYDVTTDQISQFGGSSLFAKYNGSIWKAFQHIYPTHDWSPWRFSKAPKGYWSNLTNHKDLLDWLGRKLQVESLDDWYRISFDQISSSVSLTAFNRQGLGNWLRRAYPAHPWSMEKFLQRRNLPIKASQRKLLLAVKNLFPSSRVCEDYWHPQLEFASGQKMQLDVFLPDHHLAFEYQGQQHYLDCFNVGPQWIYSQRDSEKRISCRREEISLVEVPYWWDQSKYSLQASIQAVRPDLID